MSSSVSSTSTSSYSYLSSSSGRYTGLASGIDTEGIMEKLMKAESMQKESLQKKYQTYEWKRDSYRDFETKLSDFRDELYNDFQLTSSWNAKTATSSNSAVSVKASSTASGTLSVSNVQLATAGKTITNSGSSLNKSEAISSTKLSEITQFSSLFSSGDTATIKVKDAANNEFEFAVNKTDTMDTLISRINSTKAANNSTVSLNASLVNGSLSISSSGTADVGIQDAANAATTAFNNLIGSNSSAYTSDTLVSDVSELEGVFDANGKATLQFANGEQVEINNTMNLSEVADAIIAQTNGALGATFSESTGFKIFEDAGAITANTTEENTNTFISSLSSQLTTSSPVSISGDNKLSDLGLSENGYFSLNVLQADGKMKPTTIQYAATDTISSFINKINTSGAGVKALYSDGQFSLAVNATGKNSSGDYAVEIIDTPADQATKVSGTQNNNIFSIFGIESANGGLIENGSDASYTVNGVTMSSSNNTVSLNGYTLTFNSNYSDATPITLTSSTDTDTMVEKIKSFVKSYNELIDSINTKTAEKKNYNYEPLTDAQKAEMTEDEIKKWEEKAKTGLLRNDSYLSKVVSNLRTTMYSEAGSDSVYNYLFEIGITTSSSYTEGGKLEIDEAKLRTAIEDNPDAVMKMFTDTDTGVISQTRKILKTGIDSIKTVAGTDSSEESSYTLGKQMKSLKSKIDDWTDRLEDIEERYWAQFTAMETAISNSNSVTSIFA